MMARKRYCASCGKRFEPDIRVGARQKSCSTGCRKVLKSRSNERFRRKNSGYWNGRYEIVKAWRVEHPDYQRIWRSRRKERRMIFSPGEIQAEIFGKTLDIVLKNVLVLREIQAEIPFQMVDKIGLFSPTPC